VLLDGHQSYDSDGDLLEFHWSLLSVPDGSAAVISSDESLVHASLIMDLSGIYVGQLLVQAEAGNCSIDTVMITSGNVQPVALAGNGQAAEEEGLVPLIADRSTDLNEDSLPFAWSLLAAPVGSEAFITHPHSMRSFLSIDIPGTYLAQVMVRDGRGGYDVDTVLMTTGYTVPLSGVGEDPTNFRGKWHFWMAPIPRWTMLM